MPNFPNFYENTQEAQMRLRSTVVLYDREPYHVLAITEHKPDGIFRIYLEPIGWSDVEDPTANRVYPSSIVDNYPPNWNGMGPALDAWLETDEGKKSGILRKMMNSPLFNKFRPFPLGMINYGTSTYYVERQPTRKSEQGLTGSMLYETLLTTSLPSKKNKGLVLGIGRYPVVSIYSKEMQRCIKGEYPSAEECLLNLSDPAVDNESAAFNRNFALVRGPCDLLFLAYKEDIVGVLPKCNFDLLRLGRDFGHCREVVESLSIFNSITG